MASDRARRRRTTEFTRRAHVTFQFKTERGKWVRTEWHCRRILGAQTDLGPDDFFCKIRTIWGWY
jgi:hypothetical protein